MSLLEGDYTDVTKIRELEIRNVVENRQNFFLLHCINKTKC